MTAVEGQPDWPALFLRHRVAMYRVAASVLREGGLADRAEDAVMDAIMSLMNSPPPGVREWEAILVSAAKRRAIDILRSASTRHAGPTLADDHDRPADSYVADDVAEYVDRQRACAVLWDKLAVLDARHRTVAWECVAMGRPRAEVAAELGVTPARVSQMRTKALELLREAMEGEEVMEP